MAKATAPPSVLVEEQPYTIPDNWRWTRLEDSITWGSGGTPSRKHPEYFRGNIPWVKTGELDDTYIYETEEHLSEEALQNSSAKLYPVHTVIVAMYGATVGKTGVLKIPATTNQACACGVCSPSVNYRFLFYYLRSQKDIFIDKSRGGAQPNISQQIIKSHTFPLPPLPEQRRIVERIESLFAKLDGARDRAQAVLDGYEYRRAAILHKAFTGELTAKWRAEHGVTLDSWKTVRLSDVCAVNPPRTAVKNLPDTLPVSFVPMSAVSAETGTVADDQTRPLGEVRNGFPNFSEGDLLFAKITPCMENGKSALVGKLVNGIGYGSTEFYVIRCGEELSNRLLFHLVRGAKFRKEAKAVMTGSVGQMRTPRKFIERYEIPLPSKAEQEQIVLLLDMLFDKERQTKAAAEKVLESVDLMKKAILGRAFRGLLGTNRPEELRPIP